MRFLLILFVSILLIACTEVEESAETAVYDGPVLLSENVDVVYTDSARVKFTMKAPQQIKRRDQNEEFPKGIYLEFFDQNEKKETTLISTYALYDKNLDQWFVKGDVVLNNFTRKRILRSEELYWSSKKQEVWCDTNVRVIVETEDQTLYGKGLKAKDDFSDYEIYKPTGSFEL